MAQPDPSPLRRRRAFGALLVIVGVALFGLMLFQIVGPRPVPPPKVIHYTPQQAADARQDLDALRAQLLAPPSAASSVPSVPVPQATDPSKPSARTGHAPAKPGAPVRVQLSQADLNTYLATDAKVKTLLASRGIQAVQLLLQAPHAITCRAAIRYKGRKTNVQITGDLLPDRSTVAHFVATKAQVGALPLPTKVVTDQANRIAGQFLGRLRGRIPVTVQSIQVVGDHLVLTGIRRSAHMR